MTPQDLLNNLAQLEKELNSIKSARMLAEETIQSYKTVTTDIKNLFQGFESVTNLLNSIAGSLANENISISNEIKKTVSIVNTKLETLNANFANNCNSIALKFTESIDTTVSTFNIKSDEIVKNYNDENLKFKANVAQLITLKKSIDGAVDTVSSLKADIATLQKELNESQKGQDKTLEKIASDLEKTGNNHVQILTQIANDLRTSQDSQDEDLTNIKDAISSNTSKLNIIISKIDDVSTSISEKSSSIQSEIVNIASACNLNKVLIIINILITIASIAIALIKFH